MVNVALILGKTLTSSASWKDWIFESLDKGSSMDFFPIAGIGCFK